jgi:hypothetical protein
LTTVEVILVGEAERAAVEASGVIVEASGAIVEASATGGGVK